MRYQPNPSWLGLLSPQTMRKKQKIHLAPYVIPFAPDFDFDFTLLIFD